MFSRSTRLARKLDKWHKHKRKEDLLLLMALDRKTIPLLGVNEAWLCCVLAFPIVKKTLVHVGRGGRLVWAGVGG